MAHYVTRVNRWNEARYPQVLDCKLAHELLNEEGQELNEANENNDIIETLDALGDLAFVAIGILWKAGVEDKKLIAMLDKVPYSKDGVARLEYFHMYSAILIGSERNHETTYIMARAMSTLERVIDCLSLVGIAHKFADLVTIICDSNETKALPKDKVDPSVKANVDKGESFVPPTEALEQFKNRYWETVEND